MGVCIAGVGVGKCVGVVVWPRGIDQRWDGVLRPTLLLESSLSFSVVLCAAVLPCCVVLCCGGSVPLRGHAALYCDGSVMLFAAGLSCVELWRVCHAASFAVYCEAMLCYDEVVLACCIVCYVLRGCTVLCCDGFVMLHRVVTPHALVSSGFMQRRAECWVMLFPVLFCPVWSCAVLCQGLCLL